VANPSYSLALVVRLCERRLKTLRRFVLLVGAALVAVVLLVPGTAVGKSVGGCPESASEKWELVTVASLGIPPEDATGIPSLDGNGDGLTCIKPMPNHPFGPDTFVFRDNTV
jgi:hypothetical protein